jgi:hypothetical protein
LRIFASLVSWLCFGRSSGMLLFPTVINSFSQALRLRSQWLSYSPPS